MLRNIILLVKDPHITANFYHKAFGMVYRNQSESLIEMGHNSGSIPLIIKETYEASQLTTGYTPILSFDVEDLDFTVKTALEMGGMLDGPVQFPAQGKFGAIRSPDGHIIGIFEPAK